MKLKVLILALCCLIIPSLPAQKTTKKTAKKIVTDQVEPVLNPDKSLYFTNDPKMDKFIDELLAKMTLEEKIGQLNLPSAGDFTTGQVQSSDIGKKVLEGKVGGLFNIKGVDKIRDMQRIAVEGSRMKIPLIFGMDVIHGYETTFPIPLGLASSWDMDLIRKSAQIAAAEATADGIN